MYKFKRNIYLEDRTIEMWFGLTSKSRDRHSNFTLYLLTEGPDSPFSYAEQIKSGVHSKSEAERYAIKYAKDLLHQLLEQEKAPKDTEASSDEDSDFDNKQETNEQA